MKIAILGDTHFGARGDSPHFHNYFKKFYEEVFFPYLKANDIRHVIQLGDVFDRRKFVNYQTLKNSKEYFFNTLDRSYNSWLMVGNHDTYYKNTNDVNSINLLLGEYSNIQQVHKCTEIDLNGMLVLMVPWISPENYVDVMNDIALSRAQVCMGHFEISGFEMHKGAFCDDGLSMSIFDKFDLVISGHFHTKSTRGNITYLGTPYEMTWSDWGDTKGFGVLDTTTRELSFVNNPITMFHKIWYDDLNSSMDEVLAADFSNLKNTIVKVIIKNKTTPVWFDMYIDKLEKAGVLDLQIVEDHLNLNLEDDADIVNEAEDTLTILSKYVDQLDIKADKSRLDNLLRSLYNEALSME